jgi:hypothetical protein
MSKPGFIPAPAKIACCDWHIALIAKHRGDGTEQSPQVWLHPATAAIYLSSLMPLQRATDIDGR